MTAWSFASGVPESSGADPLEGLLPGARVGAWTVLAQLGEGGMSRVYRARGPRGELAALKVLSQAVDPEQRARFLREGQLARALGHAGVVPLLDAGEVAGVPFLAYQLIEGGPGFLQRLAGAGLRERVELLRDVARAVGQAHARGVVHRDLKPDNVLVDARGRPHVTDFGLALVEGEARLTRSGAVVGTPLYMAPEQGDPDQPAVGPGVDVWALGVMLYQALTGQHPFPARSWLELRRLVGEGRLTPPRQLFPALPPSLEAVCLSALAVDPARRFPHAEALAAALDAVLAGGQLPEAAPALEAGPRVPSWLGAPQELGRRGRFELRGVLGRGGMGVVYLAWDPELRREVALKMVMGARGSARLERFRREGEVTAALSHPGIVRVHGLGVLEETPYIVYELIPEARTLRDAAPELDQRARLELVRDAARALAHAHQRGVVHRDVKPENLLLDPEGRLKVADFGLAAVEGQDRLTRTGALVGTPHYMAPELVGGQRDQVGPHTDVWSLGVVLYELLCGVLPFQAEQMVELAGRILEQPLTPPRELLPSLDPRLDAICRRALERDRALRYRHAGELADDLDAFLGGRPLSGSTTALRPPALRARRRRATALLLAASGGGALVFAAWRATRPAPLADLGEVAPPPSAGGGEAADPRAGWLQQGTKEWRVLQGEGVRGVEGLRALQRWLEAYAEHPEADQARALRAELRAARPLLVLDTQGQGSTRVRFLDSTRLVAWSKRPELSAWDLGDGRCTRQVRLAAPVTQVIATPDGLLTAGEEGLIRVGEDGQVEGTPLPLNALTVAADGAHAAGGTREVRLYEVGSRRELKLLERFTSDVEAVAFSPDGRLLAAASGPGGTRIVGEAVLCVWEVPTGREVARLGTRTTGRALVFAPDGGALWLGTNTGQVLKLDPRTLEVLDELRSARAVEGDLNLLQPTAHSGSLQGLAVSPDGRELYSVCKGETPGANALKTWDLASGRELRVVGDRPLRMGNLALSPDGALLAVGSEGKVEVWLAR